MKKNGYSESTIEAIGKRLKNLSKRVNLANPEEVKTFVAEADWSNGYKANVVNAYNHYTVFHGIRWIKPVYLRSYSIKKLPLEQDIDLIISYTRTRGKLAFKLVKECGLRPIEISNLTQKHFDLNFGRVYPETAKGGEARVLNLKKETIALLKQLISTRNLRLNDKIFPCSKTLQKNWSKLRNSVAERLAKPELKQIRLYDLRHFFGTMLYHKTKDIVHVQRKMGHRSLKNTLIYIDLADFQSEEYICKVAKTIEEATELIEAGFEYVTEMDDVKLFKKRK
jgi:integrase